MSSNDIPVQTDHFHDYAKINDHFRRFAKGVFHSFGERRGKKAAAVQKKSSF